MKKIWLKKGKDAAIKRFHPWVFSGAVAGKDPDLLDGDVVEVLDHQRQVLGVGHYQNGSITVRILSFSPCPIDAGFWHKKLRQACDYRRRLGLVNSKATNCYRLVHAAGDQLPGLVIDVYGAAAVIQCHSIGMHLMRGQITQALLEVMENQLQAVYDKSEQTLPSVYAAGMENSYLFGEGAEAVVSEYGHSFIVDWAIGQKTGFFLDQRENRHLLTRYAAGKRILNAFCYSGGFSVYALAGEARQVDSVDISENAIALTQQNIALNAPDLQPGRHRAYQADVLEFLKDTTEEYDLIILDPPAFAKSKHKRHKAVQAYKRINALALKQLKPGDMLFTFSCSKVVDKVLFKNTVLAAAMEGNRQVRLMHELGQPPDHPINFFHPEGEYLKGLVLYCD